MTLVLLLLALWLSSRTGASDNLGGVARIEWLSLILCFTSLVLLPGLALWSLCGERGGLVHVVAVSFGLGLAWCMTGAALGLAFGSSSEQLARWIVASNIGLASLSLVRASRRWPPASSQPHDPWLLVPATGAVVLLLLIARNVRGFTLGGDEWFFLYELRYLLETPRFGANLAPGLSFTLLPGSFDLWNVTLALVLKLARIGLIDAYRIYIPVVLALLACLAYIDLADALFEDRNITFTAFLLQALYCLSDFETRGEGAGMAWLVRIMEAKYAACFVLVPVAQAAFVRFLRQGRTRDGLLCGILSLAAVGVHPMAAVWLTLSLGGTAALSRLTNADPLRFPRAAVAGLGGCVVGALGLAWWLRSLKESPYYSVSESAWPLYRPMYRLTYKQLIVLSRERNWYMGDPALLGHPLIVASLLCAVFLAFRIRRHLAARFLFASSLLPTAILFNPLTASILGRLVSPYTLYRVLWMLPVSLTLGWVLYDGATLLKRTLGRWRVTPTLAQLPRGAIVLFIVGASAWLLRDRIEDGQHSLRLRNRVLLSRGEMELMDVLGRDSTLSGRVLAPLHVAIHVRAFSIRLQPLPSLEGKRNGDEETLRLCRRLLTRMGAKELALLRALQVDYVVTPKHSPGDEALRKQASLFRPVFSGTRYVLYAFNERVPLSREAAP